MHADAHRGLILILLHVHILIHLEPSNASSSCAFAFPDESLSESCGVCCLPSGQKAGKETSSIHSIAKKVSMESDSRV